MKLKEYLLLESSVSRVYKHFISNESFGIISAFKGDRDRKENIKEYEKLGKELDMGHIRMQAGWKNPETGEIESELSYLIPKISLKKLIELAKKYEQYSVIYKEKEENAKEIRVEDKGIERIFKKEFFTHKLDTQDVFSRVSKSKKSIPPENKRFSFKEIDKKT